MKILIEDFQQGLSNPEDQAERSRELLQKIIDALPDHIAVLDEYAKIVAINQAWVDFGRQNRLTLPDEALGVDYLEVCDQAKGSFADEAQEVAAGIRELLARRKGSFRCEYPCHDKRERRWFQLQAGCFQEHARFYITLSHQNVTPLKEAQEALARSHDEPEPRARERRSR